MQIIYLNHPYQSEQIPNGDIVLALGFFDGVHLAHRAVILAAKEEATKRQLPLAVMTFNQHPKIVYGGIDAQTYEYLSPLQRKIELMEDLAVDILFVVEYTYAFGNQSPQTFVDNYIVGLHTQVVVAGFDYTYGKPDLANMATLPEHAQGRFAIIQVPELTSHNHKIGTTEIKELIQAGNLEQANAELGYVYENTGRVVHGKKLGRKLGFPTANVQVDANQLLPAIGVYVVEFWVQGEWHQGAASVGYNVTTDLDSKLTCEVYILDFNQMIYGEFVRIRWYQRTRGEIKFTDLDALVEQLVKDEQNTRNYFASRDLNGSLNNEGNY